MKTTIIIILSFLTINLNGFATDYLEEEFKLEDEGYINDIPFNTFNIAVENSAYYENPGFYLEDEEYVDDIPFNTNKIAANIKLENAIAVEFTLEDEETIDDLPFDTKEVIAQNISNSEDIDEVIPGNCSNQTSDCNFEQVQTSVPNKLQVIGILLIILMSAYTMTAFLL
jgi:hypothetical protein